MLSCIKSRRAVRDYKDKAVPDSLILELIKAAMFAPTAQNNKAVEFVVIKDQAIKEQIFKVVGQDFVKAAPILIIPVTKTKILPIQDLSVATAFIMLQAAESGLGSVWKNLQPVWVEPVKKILNLPKDFMPINLIPIGYAAKPLPEHSDKEFEQKKIHWEKW